MNWLVASALSFNILLAVLFLNAKIESVKSEVGQKCSSVETSSTDGELEVALKHRDPITGDFKPQRLYAQKQKESK